MDIRGSHTYTALAQGRTLGTDIISGSPSSRPAAPGRPHSDPRPFLAARTVRDELGGELLDELMDPVPLALGAAALDLHLQPRSGLLSGHV